MVALRALAAAALATSAALVPVAQAQTVTQMPAATLPLTGQESLYIIQNGQPRRVSPAGVAATAPAISAMLPDASNATLPLALQNLTLRIPGSCDGYSAEDGAISIGSANFSSASANFTASDAAQHKAISINGAGPTQYFGNATIAGGGAGHTVGEEIPLTGGTGSVGTVIVRTVSGGAITAVAGKAGSLGSYTAVPGNPVTAGDATLTASWLRNNLVTTIQGVNSPTSAALSASASATVSGALWGYGTDYAAQINAAMPLGVSLPFQWCGVASTISVDNRQVITGQGTGGSGIGPTNLLWLGPVGGTILKADNANAVNGARIGPFNIMGLGAASIGASFRGLQQSRADLHVTAVKDWAFKLEEASAGGHDTYFNDFWLVAAINTPYPGSRNAIGISFPKATVSAGAHDVNGNNFYNTAVYHQDGVGIDLEEGYMNNFFLTQLFGTGTTWGVRFGGTSVNGFERAHGNNFYDFISQAPVLAEGGTFPSLGNTIDPYDTQAYNPGVTVQTGATLYCVTNGTSSNGGDRARNLCTAPVNDQLSAGSPSGVADTVDYHIIATSTFIPRYTGNMTLYFAGALHNATNGDGGLVTGYYGTGTPPVNGDLASTAGATRFNCGGFPGVINPAAATITAPFAVKCDVPNFGRGITWWYALAGKALTGGTILAQNIYMSAKEDP